MKSLTLSPLVRKDLLTLLRTQKAFWLLWICVLICGAVLIREYSNHSTYSYYSDRSLVGQTLFYTLSFTLLILLGLSSAVIPAISITSERENRTLDMLTASGLSRIGIVLGKWFSALAYQFAILIALLPAMVAVLQLGGVGWDEYVSVAVLIVMTVATYSLLGLAISAWMRRSTAALLLTLFTIAFLNILLTMVLEFLGYLSFGLPSDHRWRAVSPLLVMDLLAAAPQLAAQGFTGLLTPTAMLSQHCLFQAVLAIFCLWMAWLGLVKGRAQATATALKPIDDPTKLEERRKQFPFYLVDPLRRPQQIADNQDPLYVKEVRSGAISRLHVLIRLGYFVMFGSFLLLGIVLNTKDFQDVAQFMLAAAGLAAFFVPILSATSVGKEFEEQTIDLLCTTPLTPYQIILAKYRVALRFVLFLFGAALLLPFIFGIGWRSDDYHVLWFGLHFLLILGDLALYLGLITALGIMCSALYRRTLVAILVHYILLAMLLVLPYMAINTLFTSRRPFGMVFREDEFTLFQGLLYNTLKLINPISFLNNQGSPQPPALTMVVLHVLLTASGIWCVLRLAGLALRRRLQRG